MVYPFTNTFYFNICRAAQVPRRLVVVDDPTREETGDDNEIEQDPPAGQNDQDNMEVVVEHHDGLDGVYVMLLLLYVMMF